MKIRFNTLRVAIMACALIANTSIFADTLEKGFHNPPSSAKPRTWWHWVDGNVTRQGITADLEAMKRVGIQEAQIFYAGIGFPGGPIQYMTDEWLESFRFAASEAQRLGLNLAFNNCAGWSSSGGPWVKPENSMQTVTFTTTEVKGGKQTVKLQQPLTRYNYYRDIAVVAFPKLKGTERIHNIELKSLSGGASPTHLMPEAPEIEPNSIIQRNSIRDLSDQMDQEGTLRCNLPAGDWTIMRFGYTTTGTQNHPATGSGLGLECDKLSRAALDAYWKDGVKPILDRLGDLAGSTVNNSLIDSYEVGCGNWSPNFSNEFQRRRGYDCKNYLPVLAGYYIESGEFAERFLWDFRKTIGELMAENYFQYFGELCHRNGMRFSVEPYGGPFNNLTAGRTSDIPMAEFWAGSHFLSETSRIAASSAHLNGTPIVGAESFTADNGQSRWLTHPATMKAQGDFAWTEGINRFIFHTFVHQPWEAAPGLTLLLFGSELNRLNTWWEQGKAYMQYVTRSQYLLQQGESVADILFFVGESSPNTGMYRQDIKTMGYDYDLIDEKGIAQLFVENGTLQTPGGASYRLLVLNDEELMLTPQLLKALKKLVKAGAIVIGKKPVKSPSLQNYPNCDNEVETLANELWDASLIRNITVKQALNDLHISPDFRTQRVAPNLCFIHRSTNDAEIYFISNQEKVYTEEVCHFRTSEGYPEIWNAESGQIEAVPAWERKDGITSLTLRLRPEESCFVVFRKNGAEPSHFKSLVVENSQSEVTPLEGLKIIKAEYGRFLPAGMADFTKLVKERVADNKLDLYASNDLAGDPAPGIVKEMRVVYEINHERKTIRVPEKDRLRLPKSNESGELRIISALYGHFSSDFDGIIPPKPVDVSQKLQSKIDAGQYTFPVSSELLAQPLKDGDELHLVFSTIHGTMTRTYKGNETIDLAQRSNDSKVTLKDNNFVWSTPHCGQICCTTPEGVTYKAQLAKIEQPLDLSETWNVKFGGPRLDTIATSLPQLTSWTLSDNDNIKYFSGTAVYSKQFNIPSAYFSKSISLELSLGKVCNIAEVRLNGKDLGILWHAPFRVNIDGIAKAGKNTLEIHVTNSWANRLIGDENLPEDVERNGEVVKKWPAWLPENKERASGRTTFTSWKKWNKGEPLQVSGMLGPVLIRPYKQVVLKKAKR